MCGNTRNGARTRDGVGRNLRFALVRAHAATGFVCTRNEARNEHMAWSGRRGSGCRSWSHGAKVRPEPFDQFRPRVCEKRPRTQVAIVQNGVIVLAFCDQRKPAHISTEPRVRSMEDAAIEARAWILRHPRVTFPSTDESFYYVAPEEFVLPVWAPEPDRGRGRLTICYTSSVKKAATRQFVVAYPLGGPEDTATAWVPIRSAVQLLDAKHPPGGGGRRRRRRRRGA